MMRVEAAIQANKASTMTSKKMNSIGSAANIHGWRSRWQTELRDTTTRPGFLASGRPSREGAPVGLSSD